MRMLPAELVRQADKWVRDHPAAYRTFKDIARSEHAMSGRKVSPNLCLQLTRRECKVKTPNAISPVLARRCMREEEDMAGMFNIATSKADFVAVGE